MNYKVNTHGFNNHNRILAIKEDSHKCKLISFCRVHYYPKIKPQQGSVFFADYDKSSQQLRVFNRADYSAFNCSSFKDALNLIRHNFTDY